MHHEYRDQTFDDGRTLELDNTRFISCVFKKVKFESSGNAAFFGSCSFSISASRQLEDIISVNRKTASNISFHNIVEWRGERHPG